MFWLDIEDFDHKISINFIILCLKSYIHRCKFQNVCPCFQVYKNLVKIKLNTEYRIAENKGQLSKHFKKFTFEFNFWADYFGGFSLQSMYLHFYF